MSCSYLRKMQFHQCIMSFTVLSDNALYKDETARLGKKKKKMKNKNYSYCKHAYCLVSITRISSKLFFEVLPQTGKLQKKII